ncbi:MAG: hypothetical protein P1S60_14450 [Anaerolineae bacterium]|nr:hypothetical protein [Anaerolineae bacterium]
MNKKQAYHRTAALLGHQAPMAARRNKRRTAPIHVPWKVVVVFVLVNTFGIWVLFGDPWYLMLDDISLYGVSTIEMAEDVLLSADILGWHSFRLRPAKAAERVLENVPGLVEADIDCAIFPASCEIRVKQRAPILIWDTGTEILWADQEGRVFPATADRSDLPVIRGQVPDETNHHSMAEIQKGVVSLIALGVPADAFEYKPNLGLIWTDEEGRRIAFGVGSEMQQRWQVYIELVEHLEAEGIFPWVIDVRFPDGVTYSLERSW